MRSATSNSIPGSLRYLALTVLSFVALTGLLVVALWDPAAVPREHSSPDTLFIYFLMAKQKDLLRREEGRRMLVIGGSSPLYGVRTSLISKELGIPVVNHALHAGLGLDYLLFNARRHLRPGDVALLVLEYKNPQRTDRGWVLADYVIPYDLGYLEHASASRIWKMTGKLTAAEYAWKIYDRFFGRAVAGTAIAGRLNAYGDLVTNGSVGQNDYHRLALERSAPVIVSEVDAAWADQITEFVAWCSRRGVKVIAGFPPFMDFAEYHSAYGRASFIRIKRVFDSLNVPTLGTPTDYLFDKSMFFDTNYHLTAEGAEIQTRKMIGHLASLPAIQELSRWQAQQRVTREVRSDPVWNIDFSDSMPGTVMQLAGFSSAEAWGRWTDGPKVRIEFRDPLPKQFVMELTVNRGFGSNVGQTIEVSAGSSRQQFTLVDRNTTVSLAFQSSSRANAIDIEVPYPASPKSLGLGSDQRALGLALVRMRIVPLQLPTAAKRR